MLHGHAAHHAERLVLGIELRSQPGGAVGGAQLQLIDAVDVEVLRQPIRPRHPVVRLPAALRTEQRRAVPPHQAVDQIAILDVETGDHVVVLRPDPLVAGAGGQLGKIDRRELGRGRDGEPVRGQGEVARRLVFVGVGGLGGVAHVPRAKVEGPHAGERRAGVERPAAAVGLDETAGCRHAGRVQEALWRVVRVVGRLLVVVVVALER